MQKENTPDLTDPLLQLSNGLIDHLERMVPNPDLNNLLAENVSLRNEVLTLTNRVNYLTDELAKK